MRTAATTGAIVGAAALGAGLFLLLRAPSATKRATAEPWFDARAFGLRGRF
jgi:hypothetical protein